jgi:hypothetical protein
VDYWNQSRLIFVHKLGSPLSEIKFFAGPTRILASLKRLETIPRLSHLRE